MIRVGDIVREKYGSWQLWRVVEVWDSTLFLAVSISNHKFHKAGERRLLFQRHYLPERDPLGFAKYRQFTLTF